MQILKVDQTGTQFQIREGEYVSVLKIGKEELFEILHNIYQKKSFYDFDTIQEDVLQIKNPVEKEITTQIIDKIKEFVTQVDTLKAKINAKYPDIK
ncbi:MAG: hypothetical protein LKI92_10485 [Schleiferilactobacillus harbinensis]|jgi:predicted RNA-binding protein|nr:hypothetical protein [Schleiferilactobacillus harbinensis]